MPTDAAIEVLSLLRRAQAAQLSPEDIRAAVGISPRTYYRWLNHGIKKLEQHRRLEALVADAERNLVAPRHRKEAAE